MPESNLSHLFVRGFSETQEYQAPGGRPRLPVLARNRQTHGARLMRELQRLHVTAETINRRREELGIPQQTGLSIVVEIRPKGALHPDTVEWRKDGIEVLSFVSATHADILVLHVPEGRLAAFERRVQAYLEKETRAGKPANMALVNAIERFRSTVFLDLWTAKTPPPESGKALWFQVWLRSKGLPSTQIRDEFAVVAAQLAIEVEPGYVTFPGRVVVAVRATRTALEAAGELLDLVAEFRSVSATAEFFLGELSPGDQATWAQELEERVEAADDSYETRIALLDTGINHAHPLLANVLDQTDMHAYEKTWGLTDHDGHGTEMAGISMYGNLTTALASNGPILLSHVLESAKILPPHGVNSPHLYGTIIQRSTELLEAAVDTNRRVFAMMTTAIGDTSGEPSEWSATIDQLAFGRAALEIGSSHDEARIRFQRLFVLAAGNLPWTEWHQYPNSNAVRSIEDPGQAWNAISVGACTALTDIESINFPSNEAIAPTGGLAPSSRTSMSWGKGWPYKPDVVAEGGNGSIDATGTATAGPDSLRLVTTSAKFATALFCETGDTSAATAEVARLCAQIWSRYPDYWPETTRALVIHGARHTAAMRSHLPVQPSQQDKRNLLRAVGFGEIQPVSSLFSSEQRPTLVLQETVKPYRRDGSVKMGHINLHALPWPTEKLLELGATQAELRITLSYFIEPNPSRRGWISKFRYPSFGLRFSLKAATETPERFLQRVNELERDEDNEEKHPDPDVNGWTFGAQLRTRGSIHSDVWTGTTTALAAKDQIAVYPVGGWWKDWTEAKQCDTEVRYSLVISIELASNVTTDIYQPVASMLQVPLQVDIVHPSDE